jgi:hypothetical protein
MFVTHSIWALLLGLAVLVLLAPFIACFLKKGKAGA